MNSRDWIDKQALSKWVGASRRDESSLLQNYLHSGELSYLLDLYRPYMHLVYGLAFKFVHEPKESQEIVYCIFKKLINEVKRQEIRVFGSWLYIMSRDICKQWRSRGRSDVERILALGETSNAHITFYDEDDDAFEKEISSMEDEIINLKKEQEKCLELFFTEQKCFQEIADITGWDVSLIKRHLRNAKRRVNIYQE